MTGAGLPFLYVAYLNRQGPGTACYTDGAGGGELRGPSEPVAVACDRGSRSSSCGIVLYERNRRRRDALRR